MVKKLFTLLIFFISLQAVGQNTYLDEIQLMDYFRNRQLIGNTSDSLLVKQKGDLSKLERSSRAQIARERINQFISSVINVEPAQRNPILIDFAGAVLLYFKKLRLSKQERQLYLDSIMLDFQASQERFKQMVNVACDEQSIFSVEALLARSGFKSVRVSVLDNQGVPVAWNIQASLF